MRLYEFLSESADRDRRRTAIVAAGSRHSYGDLDSKSGRLAGALIERRLRPGDRVVVFMDNSFEAVVAIFAVLKAGAVVVPLDAAIAADELASVLDHCRAVAIATQARLASVAAAAMSRTATVRLVVLAGGDRASCGDSCICFEEAVNRLGPSPPVAGGDDGDTAVLLYTPGTVGMVEPVAMTHRQIAAAVAAAAPASTGGDDAVVLSARSLASAQSLHRLMAAVKVGASLVVERGPVGVRAASDGPASGLHGRPPQPSPPGPMVPWDGQRRPVRRHHLDWEARRRWRD